MKRFLVGILSLCVNSSLIHAQSILPDPFPDPPSNSNFYYRNKGQIIDELGNLHPEIKYYTEKAFPAMFLADDKISFTAIQKADTSVSGDQDSIGRIDLQFICRLNPKPANPGEGDLAFCGTLRSYEPSDDHLNYYLPHCSAGIENVPGYARVVYENAFPNIDVHFYSNSWAMKSYIVIKPGGNPNDVLLKFTGQDSIDVLSNGGLAMYLRAWKMSFPQAIAYQIDASNNIVPLNWLPVWNHQGSGIVSITTSAYDLSETLVIGIGGTDQKPTNIKNLEWSVYYGAPGSQGGSVNATNAGSILYHALNENSGNFQSQAGYYPLSNGAQDWFISQFNAIGGRQWATYYGGSSIDVVNAIEESQPGSTNGELWVAGYTASLNAPLGTVPGTFKQSANAGITQQGCKNGLLASFSKGQGNLQYATYFGGGNLCENEILDISIDNTDNTLYMVGTTEFGSSFNSNCATQTTGAFPLCPGNGRYFKPATAPAGLQSGFIAELGLQNKTLNWSTLFGGKGDYGYHADKVTTVLKVHNGSENALYIGGLTGTGIVNAPIVYTVPVTSSPANRFPLVNPGAGAYVQSTTTANSSNDANNGYIAKFNSAYQLAWSTLLGNASNGVTGLAKSAAGDLYAVESDVTSYPPPANSPLPPANGYAPSYAMGSSYLQNNGQSLLARFNPQHNLLWSTRFKTSKPRLALDDNNKVYLLGSTKYNDAPTWNAAVAYWQQTNASVNFANDPSPYDGVITVFNPSNQPVWGTYFGGVFNTPTQDANSYDVIDNLAIAGHKYLFVTGATSCPNAPYKECPPGAYCDQSYNTGGDAYISRFNIEQLTNNPLSVTGATGDKYDQLLIYPNPSDGIFNVSYSNMFHKKSVDVQITDQVGRTVSATTLKLQSGENRFKIDMNGLAGAIYFIRISDGENCSYGKLQKK